MKTVPEVLINSRIIDKCLKLPDIQLSRDLYLKVKKAIAGIDGKWVGGKTQGFVFQHDPTALIEVLCAGEKRNIKKEYQFFETPRELADRLVEKAFSNRIPSIPRLFSEDTRILEPSAGTGAIIDAIYRNLGMAVPIFAFELMDHNREILKEKYQYIKLSGHKDFIEPSNPKELKFDYIIANPPFTKNQDIEHIMEMYSRLKPDGILVSLASTSWENSTRNIHEDFKWWLQIHDAAIFDVPAGTFKESGTNIATKIIMIDKSIPSSYDV